ncbi:MAG: HAMP domain-containing histidine kinase [Gammaproteobacteria bacterium]|nr:HAMP domain-containing histidine kinase [Gammaproteobacteria bacterium]
MSAAVPAPITAPGDLARRLIGLVNLYRLLVSLLLLVLHYATGPTSAVGSSAPRLFVGSCVVYFSLGVGLVLAQRLASPGLRARAFTHVGIDALAVALLTYASGGVGSGLGILLVVPVGAIALLVGGRDAFLLAALGALALLTQQVAAHLQHMASATDYPAAGVLGVVVFLVVLLVWPVASRLRESEALVERQEVDLADLAELSQYIVQHLRESILVIDPEDRIRLINESAAQMLSARPIRTGSLLGEASPKLLYLLSLWRQSPGAPPDATRSFTGADGARLIQPHFASLGNDRPGPVLVFLEDTALLAGKVQQSKLASLGRLSASIAHEIRNPVGAMSHASQLLAESAALGPDDRRLTAIIRSNADRVSGIIDNILQMSRREPSHLERLELGPWLGDFREEFCQTMQWPPGRLTLDVPTDGLEVSVDPGQLRQVLWNLCENAVRHGLHGAPEGVVALRAARLAPHGRPCVEVTDPGEGIPPELAERIFEPFFTGVRGGTGLGLFLARELAQANGATLLYEPGAGGGSLFRLVFADPRRWEL